MEWRCFKKDKNRNRHTIMGQLWDGRVVQFPADSDYEIAAHTKRCIASLNRSKRLNELPDPNLAEWINGLPEKEAQRYTSCGLLARRLLDKRRPFEELLGEYKGHLTTNCKKNSRSPEAAVFRIRRIFNAIGAKRFDDLTLDAVKAKVNDMKSVGKGAKVKPISQKTRFEYLSAIKTFGAWMVAEKKAASNPLEMLELSGARNAPVRKRRPLTVGDFRKLMSYLHSAPSKYPHQTFAWTPKDRLMIYWMAVMTGFRANELRSLTRAHVNFETSPVMVTVHGWDSKNSHTATIPIDDTLAQALHEYSADKQPHEPLLRMPDPMSLCPAFHRDLDAARIRRKFDDGSTVDFHTLRSTAICWWITENKLHLLDVQFRARLKTLELVQKYVDDYAPDHRAVLKNTPQLFEHKSEAEVRVAIAT